MWKLELYKASWSESIEFLKKDVGLLLLVSLRSLRSLYGSLVHAWFLPITLLVGLVLSLPLLLGSFYTTLLVRGARPSIDYKDSSYWQKFMVVDWIVFFGGLFILQVPHYLIVHYFSTHLSKVLVYLYSGILHLFFVTGRFWLPGAESLGNLLIFLSPLLILAILFMFDAKMDPWSYVKAIGRAILMFAYNYPFFVVAYVLFRIILSLGYLLSFPLSSLVTQIGLIGWFILVLVLFPYWVCFITNFYVKRLHEQFSLYYWR